MKKLRLFTFILAGCLIPFISFAQPERIINQWNPNGEVKDLFLNPNGESIYMVGDFEYWTNYRPYATVVDQGTLLPLSGQDFDRGIVMDIIADGSGGWYVGGAFDINENGGEADNGLFHLDADLNVIAGFPIANGQVNDLKLMGDTLIVAGKFTSIGGQARRGLAAISITTHEVFALNVPINGSVNTVDVWNDTLFVGGKFNAVNNFGNFGAQLDKFTGNVDAFFDSPDGIVNASVPDGNGGWFIGGTFYHVGDSARTSLAHLGADGRVSGWNCQLGYADNQSNNVDLLEVHGNYLYVGGRFEKIGGVLRKNAARVDIQTGEVESWDPNFYGYPEAFAFHDQTIFVGGTYDLELTGDWVSHGGLVNPVTSQVAPLAADVDFWVKNSVPDGNGGFFISGLFSNIGDSIRLGLAQIDANGAVTAFNLQFDAPFTQQINSLAYHDEVLYYATNSSDSPLVAVDSDGYEVPLDLSAMPNMKLDLLKLIGDTLFLGGSFENIDMTYGNSVRAMTLPDCQPLSLGPILGGEATDVEYTDNELYIAGDFKTVNSAGYGAVIDANTLINVNHGPLTSGPIKRVAGDGQGGFYVYGEFDTVQDSACEQFFYIDENGIHTCLNIIASGAVYAMLVHGDTLFIGGDFTEINGVPRSNFAAYSISNAELLDWNPSFDSTVRDFAMDGERLFVAGSFMEVEGTSRTRLAGFNLQTSTLLTFAPQINGIVYAIHVHQNKLYVGGSFNLINTMSTRLASFDLTTMGLTGWNPNPNNWVFTISSSDNQIFVGGRFSFIGGTTRYKFAAFNNGSAVPNSISFPYNKAWEAVNALGVYNEKLLIGGRFDEVNNVNYIVYNLETNQVINTPHANGTVECIAVSGDSFFVGGHFTKIAGVPTAGLIGMNMTTGDLTGFNPVMSGSVSQLELDGDFLYAGGRPFTVDGTPTGKLAIFNRSTGAVVNTTEYFNDVYYNLTAVTALYKHNDRMYVGLTSTSTANGYQPNRNFAACINTIDQSLTDFDPQAFGDVKTISATDDAVYIGGNLIHLGGTKISGFAAYDVTSGDFLADQLVISLGNVFALAVYNDILIAGGSNISAGSAQRSLVAYNLQTQQEKVFTGLGLGGVVTSLEIYNDVLYYGGNNFFSPYQSVGGWDFSTDSYLNLNLPLYPAGGFIYDLGVDASGLYVAHASAGLPNSTRYISAYNPATGARINGWGIDVTGDLYPQINTLSLQGDHLYIGGNTTLISNNRWSNLASISLADGLQTQWKPTVNNTINSLLADDSGLYVGGAFTAVNGNSASKYFTRFNLPTDALLPSQYGYWVKNEVYDLDYNPNNGYLYLSGRFNTGDGSAANSLLALSTATNQMVPNWPAAQLTKSAYITYYNDALWVQEADYYGACVGCFVRKLEPSGAFSEDSLPIFGQNVRTMAFQDDRIMLGGNFQGVGGIARKNILEIDAVTGEVTDFDLEMPLSAIHRVVREGDNLIVLGKVGTHYKVMAYDVNTYENLPAFTFTYPDTDYQERDLALYDGSIFYKIATSLRHIDALTAESFPILDVDNSTTMLKATSGYLYTVGTQYGPNGVEEPNFAKRNIETGSGEDFWPELDAVVQSLSERDGKLFMAGNFTEVNGLPRKGLVRFDGATGDLDDWTAGDLPPVDYASIISTEGSLYYSYLLEDENFYKMRSVDPVTGNLSLWTLPVEAVDAVEVAGRLYVAGYAFPEEFVTNGYPFTAYELQSCNTQLACSDATIYLNANGEASLTTADVDMGTTSECTITSLALSQTDFSCNDLGENEVYLTAITDDGASASCLSLVTVADTIHPQLAVQDMDFQLPEAGTLELNPIDFVVDMNDNCGIDSVYIIGQTSFTCADQGQAIAIQIAVKDHSGNISVAPATVSILISAVCCEAEAAFTANTASICVGESTEIPIQLVGIPPFEVTLANDGIVFSVVIPGTTGSITVAPSVTTTYQLVSVSDYSCLGVASGAFEVIVEQSASAGPDQDFSLCADGEAVTFNDYIHPDAGSDAEFLGISGGIASSALSGNYALVDFGQLCINDTALYQFTFTDPGVVSNLEVTCGPPNPYFYEVTFTMDGGTAPFMANGGTFSGNIFTSEPISGLDSPQSVFAVSDTSGCVVEVVAEIVDTDGDGVCDEGEIVGCMNPIGSNYNPLATDPGFCSLEGLVTGNLGPYTEESGDGWGIIGSGEYEFQSSPGSRPWSVALFPNPVEVDKAIRLLFKDIPADVVFKIEVRDIAGRIIQMQELAVLKGNMQLELPLKEMLSEGVYLVSFVSEDVRITERLVVVK